MVEEYFYGFCLAVEYCEQQGRAAGVIARVDVRKLVERLLQALQVARLGCQSKCLR